jgi:hypothetical protein
MSSVHEHALPLRGNSTYLEVTARVTRCLSVRYDGIMCELALITARHGIRPYKILEPSTVPGHLALTSRSDTNLHKMCKRKD